LGEDYWGGERNIALQVFHLLRDNGLEPVALYSYSGSLSRLRRPKLTYLTGDIDPFAAWHYLRALSKMKPDIVLGWYDQDTSLVYACQRLAVPLVLAAHIYWLQCPILSLTFAGTTRFCSGPQLYCGTEVWKSRGELAARVLGPAFGKAILSSYRRKLNRINTYAKSIIACSDFVKSILVRDGFKNVRAIPNGINPSNYHSVPSENPPTVMFSGQTSIVKGFPHFLQMADIVPKQFPECRFVFTGENGKLSATHKD
jgi:glycosyltransferase involved in cell wall biosynthesis